MSFIAKQPNGLLCRHSTIVDCITDYNMTEEDYIEMCAEKGRAEARGILQNEVRDIAQVKEAFIPRNMPQAEFESILRKMEISAGECRHVKP